MIDFTGMILDGWDTIFVLSVFAFVVGCILGILMILLFKD